MPPMDHIPLLKIFLLLAGGIIFAEFIHSLYDFPLYVLISCLVVLAVSVLFFLKYGKSLHLAIGAGLFLFLTGIFLHSNFDERNRSNHFTEFISSENYFLKVEVISKVKTSAGFRIKTRARNYMSGDSSIEASGNLLIFTDSISGLNYCSKGDFIICKPEVITIPGENNPKAFDPSTYFHYFNVHYQCFAVNDKFFLIRNNQFSILRIFEKWNKSIQTGLREIIKKTSNANLAISIILGNRQDLDRDLLSSFSSTGLTHVLSVSGMHVGIVALILNWIFSIIGNRGNVLRVLKIVFQLTGIWSYSFLAGNEPAVLRAAFMISLILIGMNLKRYLSSLNILFGSAIILLIFNPFQLFQLSFLFSYSSMLGILIFYKPIYELFNAEKNSVTKYLWQMASLSLSSQVFLYPLLIYYFHNGPSLFIAGALIATPMSFAAMALGFLGVLINIFQSDIAFFIGNILDMIFDICIYLVHLLDSVSVNVGDYIYFDRFDLFLIYTLISLVSLYFFYGKRYLFFSVFFVLVLFFSNQVVRIMEKRTESELVFYYSKKNVVFDFFRDGNCYHYAENALSDEQVMYTCRNNRLYHYSAEIIDLKNYGKQDLISIHGNLFYLNTKTIVLLERDENILPEPGEKIDLLVVGDMNSFDLIPAIENYNIGRVLLSNKTRFKSREYISSMFRDAGIPVWDINSKGAFILRF